jgi:hypothetical protein
MLGQVEVCFGVHRVENTGRHLFVLFSCAAWRLLLLLWLALLVLLLRSLRHVLMRRCELHRRQRHILRQVLRIVHEALLELHALLLHVVLMLLLLLLSVGLLHLLLLLLLSFFLLQCCSVSLRELFGRWLFLPTPLLLEFFVDESDSPACFLVDFLEDLQTFFLLLSVGENLACVCQRSDGYGSDATAICVS